MDHPDFIGELHRLDHAESIASEFQCDLEYARSEAIHRLGDISLSSLSRDRQRRKADGSGIFLERLKFL